MESLKKIKASNVLVQKFKEEANQHKEAKISLRRKLNQEKINHKEAKQVLEIHKTGKSSSLLKKSAKKLASAKTMKAVVAAAAHDEELQSHAEHHKSLLDEIASVTAMLKSSESIRDLVHKNHSKLHETYLSTLNS